VSTLLAAGYVERALADEWFAHYQYWFGTVTVSDKYENVILQLVEHSSDEYDHATELAAWLARVPREGRIPFALSEVGLRGKQHCGYVHSSGNTPIAIIQDAIKGESCAIRFYTKFINDISRADYFGSDLGDILEEILAKEKEHLSDLEKLRKVYIRDTP